MIHSLGKNFFTLFARHQCSHLGFWSICIFVCSAKRTYYQDIFRSYSLDIILTTALCWSLVCVCVISYVVASYQFHVMQTKQHKWFETFGISLSNHEFMTFGLVKHSEFRIFKQLTISITFPIHWPSLDYSFLFNNPSQRWRVISVTLSNHRVHFVPIRNLSDLTMNRSTCMDLNCAIWVEFFSRFQNVEFVDIWFHFLASVQPQTCRYLLVRLYSLVSSPLSWTKIEKI